MKTLEQVVSEVKDYTLLTKPAIISLLSVMLGIDWDKAEKVYNNFWG